MSAIRKLLLASVALTLAAPALAQDANVLRIGLLGGENEADRLRDNQCLVDLMKSELGFSDVQLFPAADYNGVIQGLLGGTLDYAELGASAYAAVYLQDPEAVEPILTTEQTDGATGYYSIMLARKDSGIETLRSPFDIGRQGVDGSEEPTLQLSVSSGDFVECRKTLHRSRGGGFRCIATA